MEPKYKNKPVEKLIKRYCQKLEEFLSAHNTSVSIELWDQPLQFQSYMNGKLTEITNDWIKKIVINNDKIKDFEVSLPRFGFDEKISDRDIWSDARWIQDRMYYYLDLNPGHPFDKNPYWKLWDFLEKFKK